MYYVGRLLILSAKLDTLSTTQQQPSHDSQNALELSNMNIKQLNLTQAPT